MGNVDRKKMEWHILLNAKKPKSNLKLDYGINGTINSSTSHANLEGGVRTPWMNDRNPGFASTDRG